SSFALLVDGDVSDQRDRAVWLRAPFVRDPYDACLVRTHTGVERERVFECLRDSRLVDTCRAFHQRPADLLAQDLDDRAPDRIACWHGLHAFVGCRHVAVAALAVELADGAARERTQQLEATLCAPAPRCSIIFVAEHHASARRDTLDSSSSIR